MKVIVGNIVTLAKLGDFDVVIHGCNCFCTMGSGVARAIRDAFPEAYRIDQYTVCGDKNKLGTISVATVKADMGVYNGQGKDFSIVNAYTQYNYGRVKRQYVSYDAVQMCFKKIKEIFGGKHKKFAFPMIGAGLGGGDWTTIGSIIDEELQGEDYTLVVLSESDKEMVNH